MKKLLGALLCLMILIIAATAAASSVSPLPHEWLGYELPVEIKNHTDISFDGSYMTANIHTADVDWQSLIERDNYPGIFWYIKAPDDIGVGDYALWTLRSDSNTDEELLAEIQRNVDAGIYYQIHEKWDNGVILSNDVPFSQPPFTQETVNFGEYLKSSELAQPYDNSLSVIIGWFKEVDVNGQKVKQLYNNTYYRFDLIIVHDSLSAIRVRDWPQLLANRLQDYWDENQGQKPYDVTIERGKVVYLYHSDAAEYRAVTLVTPPQGAVSFSWDNFTSGQSFPLVEKTPGGAKYAEMQTTAGWQGTAQINQEDVLRFYDAQGKEMPGETMRCSFSLYPRDNEFWAYYDDHYTPFPCAASDTAPGVSFENSAADAGLSYEYNSETGQVTIDWSKAKDNVDAAALNGSLDVHITPPDGYGYYRFWWRGSNGWRGNMGTDGAAAMSVWNEMNQPGSEACAIQSAPAAGGLLDTLDAFRQVTPADNENIRIYVPNMMSEDMLIAMIVYWYQTPNASDTPLRQYLWYTHTGGMESTFVVPVADLELIKGNPHYGTYPMFKGPNGHKDEWINWKLMVTTYYQVGTNSRHYELKLVDENLLPVDPQYMVTIYLPYRDGLTYEIATSKHFQLRHYTERLYEGSNEDGGGEHHLSGTPVEVTATEYGLMYETDSFSPFIVSWQDAPVVDDPTPEPSETPVVSPSPEPSENPAVTPSPAPSEVPVNTPAPENPPAAQAPKTGDPAPIVLWIVLLAASFAGITAMMRKTRKHS